MEIKIFENEEFGKVKVINIYNNTWFVAKDIAKILGYGNGNKNSKSLANAIVDHVEEEDRKMLTYEECKGLFRGYQNGDPTFKINSNGLRVINESGLYSLVLSSKLPTAKKFKHWITSEVLPSIRKHGAYMTPETIEKALTSPDFLIQLATKLKEEKEKNIQLSAKIEQDKPKVEYHDSVINTGNLITMTNIAKDLGFRSAQPLNKILVENKIIFPKKNKDGKIKGYEVTADYNWLITEKYADYRIFDEKSSIPALRFTEKGREWIVNNITNHKWKIN